MVDVVVTRVIDLNVDDVYPLVLESEKEGFHFVRRLYDEYVSGTNRFDRDGEALFVAHQLNQIVGICGLNQDPYTQCCTVGRVRRLYVHPDFRKHGVGGRLLFNVIMEARRFYTTLTLRTDNPVADQFYRVIGFSTDHLPDNATHWLSLNADSD
ncbi:GNAT family N-acetyltransferase [Alicyclobacillus mengziensis]|uniref:GNAT family N-acetyltransferase n=1 Tax=Alicyclobacillus mengziensis TaxID=2931921 RepID=A0A9X7VW58_9BACL|nr:GNAT family N-acetyltransferase [Alicyclobacillus mengziensis]